MSQRRVLLVCSQHLFGESVEEILHAAEDLELLGPWGMNEDICQKIEETRPSVVVVAEEDSHNEDATRLTASIIEQYPELSVIRAGLTENVVRVFSTHLVPARGTDLIETIRNLPEAGSPSHERSDKDND